MIKTPRQLIDEHQRLWPNSYFFNADTLKFFGETVATMKLIGTTTVYDFYGNKHEVYVLSRLQRKHPAGPTRVNAYFDTTTLDDVSAYDQDGNSL